MRDPTAAPMPPRSLDARVLNPTTGVDLAVRVTLPPSPTSASGREVGGAEEHSRRQVLVLVPGGLTAGSLYFGSTRIADRYARHGYIAVVFDPDGRGKSQGREDYNGCAQQDGLAAVIRYASALPEPDPVGVAVVSFSYGASLATGALARHPELPVRLFVDWEGPALREHVARLRGTWEAAPPGAQSDESWWGEREAGRLVKQVLVPYQRVQSAPDHAQPDNQHALLMVRSALARKHGGEGVSPWVRLNGGLPNRHYTAANVPYWLPPLPAEIAVLPYLLELVPPRVVSHEP